MTEEALLLQRKNWLLDSRINRNHVYKLGLSTGMPLHMIFEAVFLNVSLAYNMKWIDAYYAQPNDTDAYACRECMMVALHKALLKYGKIYSTDDLEKLMGKTNFEIVVKFLGF